MKRRSRFPRIDLGEAASLTSRVRFNRWLTPSRPADWNWNRDWNALRPRGIHSFRKILQPFTQALQDTVQRPPQSALGLLVFLLAIIIRTHTSCLSAGYDKVRTYQSILPLELYLTLTVYILHQKLRPVPHDLVGSLSNNCLFLLRRSYMRFNDVPVHSKMIIAQRFLSFNNCTKFIVSRKSR